MPKPFSEAIKEKFPVTYEIPSPKGVQWQKHIENFNKLEIKKYIDAINVPYNPTARLRIDPSPYSAKVMELTDVDVIPHLTCKGNNILNLQSWLFGIYIQNIKNVLVLTGDLPMVGDYPTEPGAESINSIELITGIKKYLSRGYMMPELATRPMRMRNRYEKKIDTIDSKIDFTVGAVIVPGRSKEVMYVREKIRAGTDFFQTQIVYTPEEIINLIEEIEYYMPDSKIPVLVGTAPVRSKKSAVYIMERVLNNNIDKKVKKKLMESDNIKRVSMEICVSLYEDLKDGMKERGLHTPVGAHVMALRSSKMAAEIIRRIKHI